MTDIGFLAVGLVLGAAVFGGALIVSVAIAQKAGRK